ncbi:uncharacterized protein LOC125862883 [Solanum stenotomum]|uniref:uncharacterized protein LOC125862883 n=1 Tax=Solanum stenotomum TaxID=172797 RepID=UPI0020D1E2F4|nr:uncharacterized protein LOC125862883 [Solanum stenotomum]
MVDFAKCVEDCGLIELPHHGSEEIETIEKKSEEVESPNDIVKRVDQNREMLKKAQKLLQEQHLNLEIQKMERDSSAQFKHISHLAEMYLQQQSKVTWLKLGDDNTRYFFSEIKHRRLKLATTQLKDESGQWQTDQANIAQIFLNYYKKLLGEKTTSKIQAQRVVLQNGNVLGINHQMKLIEPFTEVDVKQAMFKIDNTKSPGPDGYGSGFFKEAWETVGGDITEAVLEFFQNGHLLKQVNATNIVLIPKVEAPEQIDLKKAYDMVSWEFLEEALQGYGFPQKIIRWIMICVSTPKYTIKINGEGYGYFEGKRGLRQGDPVSPLLFVLVMEYLSMLLKSMSYLPDFKFHPMCKDIRLNHLVFADDLMIFCKGDIKSTARVMEALLHFSATTGIVANMEKSSLFLAGVTDNMQEQLLAITGFTQGVFPIRYLGLPLT